MKEPKLQVRMGCNDVWPVRLTKEQARRLGERMMPTDLRRAGFKVYIFTADPEINGWHGYRINYGKDC